MKSLYVFAFALLAGCATTYKMDTLNPEEQAYIKKISSAGNVFEMEKKKADEAWARGNSFVSTYSGMKIQLASDLEVATFDPNASETGTTGYQLTKRPNGKKILFTVKCMTKSLNAKYTPEVCANNERILSHYMQTGEINPKFVDSKISTTPSKPTAQQ